MKYSMGIEILYKKKFFIIIKYCLISNSNVSTVVTDMNNVESSTDSDSRNEVYKINYNNIMNSVVINSNSIDSENKNINISDSENNGIFTYNVVNKLIGENRVNINNFLNNECVNIYVTGYQLYNFLPGGRDADIIVLNDKKEVGCYV